MKKLFILLALVGFTLTSCSDDNQSFADESTQSQENSSISSSQIKRWLSRGTWQTPYQDVYNFNSYGRTKFQLHSNAKVYSGRWSVRGNRVTMGRNSYTIRSGRFNKLTVNRYHSFRRTHWSKVF